MKRARTTYTMMPTALAVLFLLPFLANAQDYLPLSAIPGVQETGGSLASYVNALFLISISVGALLAVVKIAIGGVQYMMTDVVTTKQDARDTIKGALLGLGILLATFVVLYTINPQLVNLSVLSGAQPVQIQGGGGGGGGGGGCTGACQPGGNSIDLSGQNAATQEEVEAFMRDCGSRSYETSLSTGIDPDGTRRMYCSSGSGTNDTGGASVDRGQTTLTCDDGSHISSCSDIYFENGEPVFTDSFDSAENLITLYCGVEDDACVDYCTSNSGTLRNDGACVIDKANFN